MTLEMLDRAFTTFKKTTDRPTLIIVDNHVGYGAPTGEGRWTVAAANDEGVPALVLTAALFERFTSRNLDFFENKVLSAMPVGFGGHVEKK